MSADGTTPPPTGAAGPPDRSAADWLREVRRYESDGELFQAYDLARQALYEFPDDLTLKHRAVLCLASTGATQQALEQFEALGLAGLSNDVMAKLPPRLAVDLASLRARLLKDEALAASGLARPTKIAAAAAAYEAIYRDAQAKGNPDAYYPGINAATLRLLAGDGGSATALAGEILAELDARPAAQIGYYETATSLEAALITGDVRRAHEAAKWIRAETHRRAGSDLRGLASTIQQLRAIVATTGVGFDPSAELAPPHVIHYLGHIISAPDGGNGRFPADREDAVRVEIAAKLDASDPAVAFGSLAAGADILFAEALIERGASLNVFLPFDPDEFVEISVRPAGPGWVERFHRCLAAAATTHLATTDRYLGDDSLFGYCSELAMGLALLRARNLCGTVEQIAVWDGRAAGGAAGTAVDVATWKCTGMPQTIIPLSTSVGDGANNTAAAGMAVSPGHRTVRAMLFGDVKGFSKLTDVQLPIFIETVLSTFARVLDRFAGKILLANTWGDGLFLVFEDAGAAAACGLALQNAMAAIDFAAIGLPDNMALRIGGHLGPVYTARDPILKKHNFFGAHVSRAARIEPVTPEKLVYVTETLAAVLALHNPGEFSCHYVGMTKAAKDYGEMRMFLLGRGTRS
jgi:class 3 adenylate cyclase